MISHQGLLGGDEEPDAGLGGGGGGGLSGIGNGGTPGIGSEGGSAGGLGT